MKYTKYGWGGSVLGREKGGGEKRWRGKKVAEKKGGREKGGSI
jgi:hypothetical protein